MAFKMEMVSWGILHAILCTIAAQTVVGLTFSISIRVKLVDHSLELLVGNLLPELSCDSAEVLQVNLPFALLVKELEGLEHLVEGIALENTLGHCAEEWECVCVCVRV